jgi:hypothetical protein
MMYPRGVLARTGVDGIELEIAVRERADQWENGNQIAQISVGNHVVRGTVLKKIDV